MKEFLRAFISSLKIFLIVFFIVLIIGLAAFYLINFNEIVRLHTVYSNFNLIKLLFLKVESFFFLFIPAVLLITSFLTSFYLRKKISLFKAFFCIFILNLLIVVPIFIFFNNSPSMINKIKKSYHKIPRKNIQFLDYDKVYSINGNQYYLAGNTIIKIENGNFKFYKYKFNSLKNEVFLYSKGKIVEKIDLNAKVIVFVEKKIKYFEKLKIYFNEFYKFIISQRKFYYFIYYIIVLVLFILTPGIYRFDNWSFSEFFVYLFLNFIFLCLFLVSFHFTIYYLIDLKIKKDYIYLFPVILFFVIDIIIILIENNRLLKRKMLQRIRK